MPHGTCITLACRRLKRAAHIAAAHALSHKLAFSLVLVVQGAPLPPDVARALRQLLWGAHGQPPASWKQVRGPDMV